MKKKAPAKKKVAKKKQVAQRASVKSKKIVVTARTTKPVGLVTHFFGGIKVAIIKCKAPFSRGTRLRFKGATTDFVDTAVSLQYDHKVILRAKKGQQIGMKVKKRVREGDLVYIEK